MMMLLVILLYYLVVARAVESAISQLEERIDKIKTLSNKATRQRMFNSEEASQYGRNTGKVLTENENSSEEVNMVGILERYWRKMKIVGALHFDWNNEMLYFIHVPKSGGSSMKHLLIKWGRHLDVLSQAIAESIEFHHGTAGFPVQDLGA